MKREDIIRMARSAIRLSINDSSLTEFDAEKTVIDKAEFLYGFAKEIAANEREACALTCEGIAMDDQRQDSAAQDCAAAIRARGEE